MKKIVILGCENSHANSFLDFIKENPKYADVVVLGVYSDDMEAANKLSEKYGVKPMNSYDEYVGDVDGVIVTARHGDNHYKYAKPYIKSGVPMFIDKPITVSEADALSLMKECRDAGVRITGGSSCKHATAVKELKSDVYAEQDGKTIGGFVRAPINMDNPYGGFYFYSQHLVEMVAEIFGRYPKSVKAYCNGGNITVIFRYPEYDIAGMFVDRDYAYSVVRQYEGASKTLSVEVNKDCFALEFDEFYELLSGSEQKISYKDFVSPVFILNAIERSLESGDEITVKDYEI